MDEAAAAFGAVPVKFGAVPGNFGPVNMVKGS